MMNAAVVTPDWVETISVGNLITWILFLGAIYAGLAKLRPFIKRFLDLTDDMIGEPKRPGVPARLGVMERLEGQENLLKDVSNKIIPLLEEQANHDDIVARLTLLNRNQQHLSKQSRLSDQHMNHIESILLQHIRDSQMWIHDLGIDAANQGFVVPNWPLPIPNAAGDARWPSQGTASKSFDRTNEPLMQEDP